MYDYEVLVYHIVKLMYLLHDWIYFLCNILSSAEITWF